ncbi:MAG: hypothetical protein ACI9SI_000606 [Polaribacter sp.]|jgi:hypothetical protein
MKGKRLTKKLTFYTSTILIKELPLTHLKNIIIIKTMFLFLKEYLVMEFSIIRQLSFILMEIST